MDSITIQRTIDIEEELIPFIEGLTSKSGQDAVEHFAAICIMNLLEPQEIIDALSVVKMRSS